MLVFPAIVLPLTKRLDMEMSGVLGISFWMYLLFGCTALPWGMIADRWGGNHAPRKGSASEKQIHPETDAQNIGHFHIQTFGQGEYDGGEDQHIKMAHEMAEAGIDQYVVFAFFQNTI